MDQLLEGDCGVKEGIFKMDILQHICIVKRKLVLQSEEGIIVEAESLSRGKEMELR